MIETLDEIIAYEGPFPGNSPPVGVGANLLTDDDSSAESRMS